MTATPALPGGPAMPEQPEPVTSAELAAAIRGLQQSWETALRNTWDELAAATAPGRNVRDLPSDEVSCYYGKAMDDSTQVLVPADESRTKVTLIASAADVWIAGRPGATPGQYDTCQIPAGIPVELDTRATIYAATNTVGGVDVSVIVQSAHYRL